MTEAELDERLSRPTAGAIEVLRRLPGDLLVLGAGGKMGPSLCRMARRALDVAGLPGRVIAVSRFGNAGVAAALERDGVVTHRATCSTGRRRAAPRGSQRRLHGGPEVRHHARPAPHLGA